MSRLVMAGTHHTKQPGPPTRFSDEDVARIYERDKVCVLSFLAPGHVCVGRLTLEHVLDSPRMGKRAPSDRYHAVLACLSGNAFTVETSKYRPLIREYLAKHEPRGWTPPPTRRKDERCDRRLPPTTSPAR